LEWPNFLDNGKVYTFQPDAQGGYHGYPVPGNKIPNSVLNEWKVGGIISNREYNKLRRGK